MLVIRKEQIEHLGGGTLRAFENEMVQHLAEFSPPLYRVIKDDQLREVVRFGIGQAERYSFKLRGPVRLYLEMMLLFGSHFDTDPQYPWAKEILVDRHSRPEMERADLLCAKVTDYQEKVSGPNGEHTQEALEGLQNIGRNPLNLSSNDFEESVRREMYRVFPQKVEYIGNDNLGKLIRDGRAEAKKYDFPVTSGETLMVVLKFAFGHGCADDGLYPWIGRTLKDERISTPAARAERLERKSITWLDHVLKGSLGEEQI